MATRAASRLTALALVVAALGGCETIGTYFPVMHQFGVYKLDINQGNYLSQDMVDKLKVGQTRQQVRTILGTPLLTSVFRPDRWDYAYEYRRQGRAVEHRNFTVYFVDDKLARWEGDEMPQSMAELNRAAAGKALPPDHTAEDKGVFGWLLDLFPQVTATRVAIAGAGGRMGQALLEATLSSAEFVLASAFDIEGSPVLGRDAGERFGRSTGVIISRDGEGALRDAEVLIDFTRPEGTLAHLAVCAQHGIGAVIGTTGLDDSQRRDIAAFAERIPVVLAPNMSVGVNVLLELVELAAKRLGPAFDIEIVEMHHHHKIDAPSGTALRLGEAAASGAGRSLAENAVYAREGVTGERKPGTIGFATLRGGDVVGEHTVIFAGAGERLELAHKATSRQNFATGALRAARYVAARRAARRPGLADMRDVLGL